MLNQPAEIRWQDGQPVSEQYGDVYFSRDSGLAETYHVFLRHNQLEERWASLQASHFTIAETGFGTGLNFLCAWELWLKHAPEDAHLHFISCEKHPLKSKDMKQALHYWPTLQTLSTELLAQYQQLPAGMHRMEFAQGRVILTLLIGDATAMLAQLHTKVDAWFLDGFAPAKNPEMWQSALFKEIARLSHAETSFATFTSAGFVRRGLIEAGFAVNKVTGYGSKRDMLCGRYAGETTKTVIGSSQSAIVIGAGIAGCASSYALAKRGWQVSLIERHDKVAEEASGNPVAVLYPRLAMQETLMSQLSLAGFLHSNRLIQQLALDSKFAHLCGLLQLAFDARELERCQAVASQGLPAELVRYVDKQEASQIAGVTLPHDALHFPQAGWVKPKSLCEALIAHQNITLKTNHHVLRITHHDGQWQVWDGETLLDEAPTLIIATANEARHFSQTAHLPLQAVRGQVSLVASSELSQQLRTVVCTHGYMSPNIDGQHCLGATFSPDDTVLDVRAEDHAHNLDMLHEISPALAQSFAGKELHGRAAFRAATPDYLPLVGEVMDAALLSDKPPKHYEKTPDLPYLHGLYINTGHGSKGITQAPLCAELLASAICGEPLPMNSKLVAALDPNRFLLRKLGLKHLVRGLAGLPEQSIS